MAKTKLVLSLLAVGLFISCATPRQVRTNQTVKKARVVRTKVKSATVEQPQEWKSLVALFRPRFRVKNATVLGRCYLVCGVQQGIPECLVACGSVSKGWVGQSAVTVEKGVAHYAGDAYCGCSIVSDAVKERVLFAAERSSVQVYDGGAQCSVYVWYDPSDERTSSFLREVKATADRRKCSLNLTPVPIRGRGSTVRAVQARCAMLARGFEGALNPDRTAPSYNCRVDQQRKPLGWGMVPLVAGDIKVIPAVLVTGKEKTVIAYGYDLSCLESCLEDSVSSGGTKRSAPAR